MINIYDGDDGTLQNTLAVAEEFRSRGARVWVAAPGAQGDDALPLPTGIEPIVTPLLAVQSFSRAASTLALAPGVVVAYERNSETNSRLEDSGIEVLPIAACQLGTGRGGPRCMSCPAARDPL